MLLDANKQVRDARAADAAALMPPATAPIAAAYDAALAMGFAWHGDQAPLAHTPSPPPRRNGYNLLLCLRELKADVLGFVDDFDVVFTNNKAEQEQTRRAAHWHYQAADEDIQRVPDPGRCRNLRYSALGHLYRMHAINILRALTLLAGKLVTLLPA